MIAIPAVEKMRKAFKLSNMTGKERVLYFVWVLNLFTEWQTEKYYNGTMMQSLEGSVIGVLFLKILSLVSCFKQKSMTATLEWLKKCVYENVKHYTLSD